MLGANLQQVRASNLQELVYKPSWNYKAIVSVVFDYSDRARRPLDYEDSLEITVFRQKLCCFVICPSREEADKAVDAFHDRKMLPGASSPLKMKYDGELERLGGLTVILYLRENKVFIHAIEGKVFLDGGPYRNG